MLVDCSLRGPWCEGGGEARAGEGDMAADDARPTDTLTHLPSDSGTAIGPSRSL